LFSVLYGACMRSGVGERPIVITDGRLILVERRLHKIEKPWDIPRLSGDIRQAEVPRTVLERLGQVVETAFVISLSEAPEFTGQDVVDYWGCRVEGGFNMRAASFAGEGRGVSLETMSIHAAQTPKTPVLEAFTRICVNGKTPIQFATEEHP